MPNIANQYLVKRGNQNFSTIASLFGGVKVLKIDGFTSLGKPINVYTAQWVNGQSEDYMVTSKVEVDGVVYDAIFRENVDLEITFVVADKYGALNVREQHDAFVAYMTDGAIYIKSNYADRTMKCVCLKEYKPTVERLKRPVGQNYMMGTITLHTLDVRAGDGDGYIGNPYMTPSDEQEPSPTPPTPAQVSSSNVYDAALGGTQAELNQQFATKNEVTQTANAIGSAINDIGVFDISAYNLTDDEPTSYESLADALGNNGANVPQAKRRGGMMVKFIETATSRYVFYVLTSTSWNTNTANWNRIPNLVHLTQQAYDSLTQAVKMNGDWYFIEED